MGVAPDDRTFLQKLQGLLVPATQEGRQFNTDLGLSLLANSGYSATPRTFGQTLGVSALQAQQASQDRTNDQMKRAYMQAQIQAMQVKPAQSTPSSVLEYEYAKQNGFKGSFEDWQTKARGQNDPADVAVYKYWNSLSPEERQNFLKLKRNVGSDFAIETVNGVPTVVYKPAAGGNSTIPLTTPLTNLPQQAAGASAIKQAEATGGKVGEALGNIQGGIQTKGADAVGSRNIVDIADPLIDVATGSAAGAAADRVAGFFGKATTGAEAIAKLRVLQAALMMNQPRMEGPQGEKDVELYQQAAGQIGDPAVPRGTKKAALQAIRQLQQKYMDRAGAASVQPSSSAPQAAIDYLKTHPEAADQFKAKYGYLP